MEAYVGVFEEAAAFPSHPEDACMLQVPVGLNWLLCRCLVWFREVTDPSGSGYKAEHRTPSLKRAIKFSTCRATPCRGT